MSATTTPAPAAESSDGALVPGTIGFDLYLSVLRVSPSALRPPRAVSCPHPARTVPSKHYAIEGECVFRMCVECGQCEGTVAIPFGATVPFTWDGYGDLRVAIRTAVELAK